MPSRDSTAAHRADEPECSDGNPRKKSRFLPCRKYKVKIKNLKCEFTRKLEIFYFYSDFFYTALEKDKKNGERDGTRTRNIHRDRVAL